MRIVLLGPPGSGKAKFCKLIGEQLQMPVLTAASVLQRAAAEDSELGRLAGEAMNSNRVSDELLLALLRVQLAQPDLASGFVLVDFPRNAGQADVLDSILDSLGRPLDMVLYVHVDPDELMERLVGRITCEQCGAQYNLYVNPPTVEGVCDVCGTRVSRRPDDYEETISNRLRIYEGQTGPLTQYYALQDKLHEIAGDAGVQAVWPAMRDIIESTSKTPVTPDAPPPRDEAVRPAGQVPLAQEADLQVAPSGSKERVMSEPALAASEAVHGASREKGIKSAKTVAPPQAPAAKKPKLAKKPITTESADKTQSAKQAASRKRGTIKPTALPKKATTKKRLGLTKKVAAKKQAVSKKKVAAKPTPVKGSAARKRAATAKVIPKKTAKKTPRVVKAAKQGAVAKPKNLASKKSARPATGKKKPAAKQSAAKKKSIATKAPAKKATKKKSKHGKRP